MGDFGFEIEPTTGKFKIVADLEKVLYLINRLRSKLDEESNRKLKELLDEIGLIYDKIDSTLNPFYSLSNDSIFQKEFGGYLKNFKDIYNKDLSDVKYSCEKVEQALEYVVDKHQWQTGHLQKFKSLFTRRKEKNYDNEALLKEVRDTINNWYVYDIRVYENLREYHKKINDELLKVNMTLNNGKIPEARLELHTFLNNLEPKIKNLRDLRIELKRLSDKLKR